MCQWWSTVSIICRITQLSVVVDSTTTEPFDTDKMALEFVNQFPQQAFTVGQELVFSFMEKKVLTVAVRELEGCIGRRVGLARL